MSAAFSVKIDGQLVEVDEKDIWTKPSVNKPIIKHDGVRRLMVRAGIKVESLEVVIAPSESNGMRTAFLAIGTNADGRRAFAVGEADAANLTPNSVAAKFPTVMAAKRAVDRLALDLLGLFDLYSEIELTTNGENGSGPSSPTGESGSLPSESRTPDADATGSSNGNGATNGNTDTPPTEKQLSFLRGLAQRSGMEPEEIQAMMEAATTRRAASYYINHLKSLDDSKPSRASSSASLRPVTWPARTPAPHTPPSGRGSPAAPDDSCRRSSLAPHGAPRMPVPPCRTRIPPAHR